jgi:hypothetical protein
MSVSSKKNLRKQVSADTREFKETPARHQSTRGSSDVAEVVNRPKKRPGRRLRSSITIGAASWQPMLLLSGTILIF